MYKILIVDDNITEREGLCDLVDWQSINCIVVGTAVNGKDGFDKIEELKPDLVISDISMPVLNGIEMLAKAKQMQFNCGFIFMSCYDEFAYLKSIVDLGETLYLLKPVTPELVAETVLKAIEVRSELQINKLLKEEYEKSGAKLLELSDDEFENQGKYSKIIADTKKIIHERYAEIENVNFIADMIEISPNYLHMIFKRETGETILDYITRKRIDIAKKLLADPYCKVYEIAEKVGYKSTNYFATVFKSVVGMTPSEYRKDAIQ